VYPLFEALDRIEKQLTGKDYLVGDRLTEADVRLFVTIVRCLFTFSLYLRILTFISGPLRPRLLQPLQVQHPYDPGRLSRD
jgi:glutathione S-transferase